MELFRQNLPQALLHRLLTGDLVLDHPGTELLYRLAGVG